MKTHEQSKKHDFDLNGKNENSANQFESARLNGLGKSQRPKARQAREVIFFFLSSGLRVAYSKRASDGTY